MNVLMKRNYYLILNITTKRAATQHTHLRFISLKIKHFMHNKFHIYKTR